MIIPFSSTLNHLAQYSPAFSSLAGKEFHWLGIYKLEGSTFTLCRAAEFKERPKEFKTTQGAGILMVWKRAGI
jgi:hypothetical protein